MKLSALAALIPILAGCCPAQGQNAPPASPPVADPDATSDSTGAPQARVASDDDALAAPAELAPSAASTPEAPFPAGRDQLARRAAELEWGPCPVQISEDCKMAVLEGNPKEAGLFTLRFRSSLPFKLPAHRHPRHERVTVLDGEIHVAFGETFDEARGQTFTKGDYYVNRAGAAHTVWTTGPVVGQITGFGPWVVEPVEPTSD